MFFCGVKGHVMCIFGLQLKQNNHHLEDKEVVYWPLIKVILVVTAAISASVRLHPQTSH